MSRVGVRRVVIPGMLTTALGILMLSRLHADSGYLAVLAGMAVMALGMAFTMTPMTTMIMASVPPEHAGMGSAMNDTTRELGTTLGVAVLGSILSSGYASHISDTANALPDDARHATESSLAGARVVSRADRRPRRGGVVRRRQGRVGARLAAVAHRRRRDHPRRRAAHVEAAPGAADHRFVVGGHDRSTKQLSAPEGALSLAD